MLPKMQKQVSSIRKFNRYYTNILGLLDQHILESELSLSEVRILHEIDKIPECTSKTLVDILSMNAGYISRILKRFEKMGLLEKKQCHGDGRSQYLFLTEQGKEKMALLNKSFDEQIETLIQPLSEINRGELVKNMTTIETILTKGSNIRLEDITIRMDIKSGDIGYITYMHGWIYQEEYRYSTVFEAYVAESFYEFISNYTPKKDRLWCAEHNGKIIGCIGVVGRKKRAQLRWLLLDPAYRGIGLGKKLLHIALDFVREQGYQEAYLDTTSDLEKAIDMYTKVGFSKVSEKPNDLWREGLLEVEYAMKV